jgi:NAD(P)H-dependent FMN reductase
MRTLYIPILEGTTRPKRQSIKAAQLVAHIGTSIEEITVQLIDPVNYNFPYDGNDEENKDPEYTKITQKADGFFIVTPEYNHSFPGTLKRMLDSELRNYIHKPVAFAGVSSGPWGGVRAVEALVTTVREMGMVATFTSVYFPYIRKLFTEEGKLKDMTYIGRIEDAYTELIWMAKVLRWGRKYLTSRYHPK